MYETLRSKMIRIAAVQAKQQDQLAEVYTRDIGKYDWCKPEADLARREAASLRKFAALVRCSFHDSTRTALAFEYGLQDEPSYDRFMPGWWFSRKPKALSR